MPRKSSSKTAKAVPEKPAIEQDKPFSIPKKFGHEIDEIFSSKKRKKLEQEITTELAEDVAEKMKKMKKKKIIDKGPKDNESGTVSLKKKMSKSKGSNVNDFVDPPSRPRKKTGDGLVIYTEEELGISKADAGGTRLCPFDCDCCF